MGVGLEGQSRDVGEGRHIFLCGGKKLNVGIERHFEMSCLGANAEIESTKLSKREVVFEHSLR